MSALFGQVVTVVHQGDQDVSLRVFGDERYARQETLDGFTVVYDREYDSYFYAEVIDGRFVSSRVPVTQPPPAGLPRHLQETFEVRQNRAATRMASFGLPNLAGGPLFAFAPNNGLLSGRQLNRGAVRGLTILVNFTDVVTNVPAANVTAMLNGANYTANGNFCSVNQYFSLVSNGLLDYTNDVVGPFTLSHNRSFYHTNLMVEEAVQLAVASGVDLARYDSRNQGIVDALAIMYAGAPQFVEDSLLWPHNWTREVVVGGVRTNLYQITGIGSSAAALSIGTFCHESGHMLCRFPDLYDYGNRDGDLGDSAGLGMYCLMASGSNNQGGRTPSPVSGYLRGLAQWATVTEINPAARYEATHGDFGTVYKYRTAKANEYFIVENRSQFGLDAALPASGLAVYHCDIQGSNEFQEGSSARHYQCALLQADGHRDLETAPNNFGDGGDLFGTVAGVALAHNTNPSTRMWDGSDSGLRISNIEVDDHIIRFTTGAAPVQPAEVTGEATPDLAIPDFPNGQILSPIPLAGSGTAVRLTVKVEISHTYIGDLRVELQSPTGRRTILHNRAGGSTKNLSATYVSDPPSVLGAQVGQPVAGVWSLLVTDLARRDTGRLAKWSIAITTG